MRQWTIHSKIHGRSTLIFRSSLWIYGISTIRTVRVNGIVVVEGAVPDTGQPPPLSSNGTTYIVLRCVIMHHAIACRVVRMDLSVMRSKFRGAMLGALAGDCIGCPFEAEEAFTSGMRLVLQRSLDKLEGPAYRAPVMQFTDDSAMTLSLAESLVEKKQLDIVDVAKRFVRSYYQEPNRGYGPAVITVFQKLRSNKFTDLVGPAKEQFNGQGSWGNGSAMRVTPLALFAYSDTEKLLKLTRETSKITHAHKVGVDGALLQALAIQKSLNADPERALNAQEYIDDLILKMGKIEVDEEGLGLEEAQPYKVQLNHMKDLISDENLHSEKVVQKLGNSVAALYSVPTAIFCFLRAWKPIDGIRTENPLRRAIQYAISLGGDTDTIGSMTGAIAGAYYGEGRFAPTLLEHCERSADFRMLSDRLFELTTASRFFHEKLKHKTDSTLFDWTFHSVERTEYSN